MRLIVLKLIFFIFALFPVSGVFSQIKIVATGTTNDLGNFSIIGNNVMINGGYGYLVKSYDDCESLIAMHAFKPTPANFVDGLFRIDTTKMFLLAIQWMPSISKIYKSVNGGYGWTKKFDTSASASQTQVGIPTLMSLAFFDSLNGFAPATQYKQFRTNNGGNSWSYANYPLNFTSAISTFGDSIAIVGGSGASSSYLSLSKDRGINWIYNMGLGQHLPQDFAFLNKDTIFGIANDVGQTDFANYFLYSFNGGANWKINYMYNTKNPSQNLPEITLKKLCIKNQREIFAAGWNQSNIGVILKTTDLGNSWHYFNTGINSQLINIGFLNDSIALVSGTGGVLLRWNYKQTVFTSLKETHINSLTVSIAPNPVKETLNLTIEQTTSQLKKLSIYNTLGRLVYTTNEPSQKTDVTFLQAGIYFLKLETNQGSVWGGRFIKE